MGSAANNSPFAISFLRVTGDHANILGIVRLLDREQILVLEDDLRCACDRRAAKERATSLDMLRRVLGREEGTLSSTIRTHVEVFLDNGLSRHSRDFELLGHLVDASLGVAANALPHDFYLGWRPGRSGTACLRTILEAPKLLESLHSLPDDSSIEHEAFGDVNVREASRMQINDCGTLRRRTRHCLQRKAIILKF